MRALDGQVLIVHTLSLARFLLPVLSAMAGKKNTRYITEYDDMARRTDLLKKKINEYVVNYFLRFYRLCSPPQYFRIVLWGRGWGQGYWQSSLMQTILASSYSLLPC